MDKNRTCVGAISGSYGVRGEVRLKSFCLEPRDIDSYAPLTSEDGSNSFVLKITNQLKMGFSGKIDGISNKEDAEKLKGTRLYVARDKLPDLSNDEYYHSDLIDMKVIDTQGCEIGNIKALHDYGAGNILEIYVKELKNTVLVPFNELSVPKVNLEEGFVIVDPPEGITFREGK